MRHLSGWELPIWASEIDKHDAYLQYAAIQAISFPNLSGPTSGKTPPHVREGNRMRDAIIEGLVRRMTGGTQTTKKHIKATQLAGVLQDYGFAV